MCTHKHTKDETNIKRDIRKTHRREEKQQHNTWEGEGRVRMLTSKC